jgi:UDP-N-acetylmuramoyl-L-alanyl-D-glutamate--2,6-diaminopimelate ligase
MNMNDRKQMYLNELVEKSSLKILDRGGEGNPLICDITNDSRRVVSGSLYVAIPGLKVHGDMFIDDAVGRGAVAVISENAQGDLKVPWIRTDRVRSCIGMLGQVLWGFENDACTLVGVTGTNGKTTVAHLFEGLYRTVSPAEKVWMFGTIDYHTGRETSPASHTTPEALDIFRRFGAAAEKPELLIMEVSSHSLALDRIGGLLFDIAVFTNLTQDHLDFHHDMESYYHAKKKLFTDYLKPDGMTVVNIDDAWGRRMAGELHPEKCVTFGKSEGADLRMVSWSCDWSGCTLEVSVRGGSGVRLTSTLRGFFNLYNMAAVAAGAVAVGFTMEEVQKAFDTVTVVDGRMDRVHLDAPFPVVVDYAHTPDALLNILRTARELTDGRLLCVFGCGGDRDRTKRPLMGAAVAECCDEAWVTSDNPRSEHPERIIDEIVEGIPLDFSFRRIVSRKEAIDSALREARAGDCLVIAGKGHETYQEIKGVRHHFDDRETVVELYKNLGKERQHHVA